MQKHMMICFLFQVDSIWPEKKYDSVGGSVEQSWVYNLEAMLTKLRDPKQLPSLTLGWLQFPTELQAERDDVPALTLVQVEHFNPKWAKNPFV